MLIDSIKNSERYMKGTFLACAKEAGLKVSYKTLTRREKAGIKVYTEVTRDPGTGWRMYSGSQIKRIIAYELKKRVRA